MESLERGLERLKRELEEKEIQKQTLPRNACHKNNFVNKSQDLRPKPHSLLFQLEGRNEFDSNDGELGGDEKSAQKRLGAIEGKNYLQSSLEPSAPLPLVNQKVNSSCVLQTGKQSSVSKNLLLKSAASAQEMTPRSQGHDFTEIMGYKNIDISRDVDQSYMLKGSNNTNKKTSSSRNASKNEDSSMLLKDNSILASQRVLTHQSYQLGQQQAGMPLLANQSTNPQRQSKESLMGSNGVV